MHNLLPHPFPHPWLLAASVVALIILYGWLWIDSGRGGRV
jgi:hypothetical protein